MNEKDEQKLAEAFANGAVIIFFLCLILYFTGA